MPRSGSGLSRLIVGGHLAVVERQQGGQRLQRSGAAEQVAGHRLGAGDDGLGVLAQRLPDRAGLGHVALRSRGGVGVDVHDVAGGELGLAQRLGHGPGLGLAGRVGLHHVVGVGGDARPGQLALDPGAAGLGVLEASRSRTSPRPRPARSRRGPRPRAGTLARARRCAGSSPASGRSRRSAAGGCRPRCRRPPRRRPGRAGSCPGRARSPRCWTRRPTPGVCAPARAPSRMLTLAGGRVGHQHRDGQRADPPGPLLLLDVPAAEQGLQAADPGGDGHPEPVPVDRVVLLQAEAGVAPGLQWRRSPPAGPSGPGAGPRPAPAPRWGRPRPGAAILTGRSSAQSSSIARDAGAAGQQRLPGAGRVTAQRGGRTDSGDDDPGP